MAFGKLLICQIIEILEMLAVESQRSRGRILHGLLEMLFCRCRVQCILLDEATKSSHLPLCSRHKFLGLLYQDSTLVNELINGHFIFITRVELTPIDCVGRLHLFEMRFIELVDVTHGN